MITCRLTGKHGFVDINNLEYHKKRIYKDRSTRVLEIWGSEVQSMISTQDRFFKG